MLQTPQTPARSQEPIGDQSPVIGDALAGRLKELEDWRERVNQVQRFQGNKTPTQLERAAHLVLSSVGKEEPFDPFA